MKVRWARFLEVPGTNLKSWEMILGAKWEQFEKWSYWRSMRRKWTERRISTIIKKNHRQSGILTHSLWSLSRGSLMGTWTILKRLVISLRAFFQPFDGNLVNVRANSFPLQLSSQIFISPPFWRKNHTAVSLTYLINLWNTFLINVK